MRQLAHNESGMTLALAMIMIVLLGVMAAGLLTFVSSDLNTVIEENRGQRAFELADAGVGAAKRQLFTDCGSTTGTDCRKYYNDPNSTTSDTTFGVADKKWSKAKGGLTLNNLDGVASTSDNALVEIQFTGSSVNPYDFTVTSTGHYGNSIRKIEAKINGIGGSPGSGNVVNPTDYTPSDILIKGEFTLTGISLFSEQNIAIKNLSPKSRQGFYNDASTNSGGTLLGANSKDPLGYWYSPDLQPPDNWNLVRRYQKQPTTGVNTQTLDQVGFAAQGKICSPTTASANICSGTDPSVADGVFGYDSTTGDLTDPTLTAPTLGSNKKQFYAKDPPCTAGGSCPTPLATQPQDKITYPFPRVRPSPSKLKNYPGAKYYQCPAATSLTSTCTPPGGWKNTTPTPLFPSSAPDDQVVVVDANGNNMTLDITNQSTGILLVWCGNLTLSSPYKGIIINLYGNQPPWSGASTCTNDRGTITVDTASNENLQAWIYADGGNTSPTNPTGTPGITFNNGSSLKAVPGGGNLASNLASIAFGTAATPPTQFEVEGWRDLYQQ
jgi:hypothetical protein